MPTPRQLLKDTLQVQKLTNTDSWAGEVPDWEIVNYEIFASVVPLFDNVNYQVWGTPQDHQIYRVMVRWETAKLLQIDYSKTRFIWTNIDCYQKTLRPIEDFQVYGNERLFGYLRCEDETTYLNPSKPDVTQIGS